MFKGPRRPKPDAKIQKHASQDREVTMGSTPKHQFSHNVHMDFTAQVTNN